MTEPLKDPCGHKSPPDEYQIYLPGSPGVFITDPGARGGSILQESGIPHWILPLKPPASILVSQGINWPPYTPFYACEIRDGANAHFRCDPPFPSPGPGYVLSGGCTMDVYLYTMWITDLLSPPLPLPSPYTQFVATPIFRDFDLIVHSSDMQAFAVLCTGEWIWTKGGGQVRYGATNVVITTTA